MRHMGHGGLKRGGPWKAVGLHPAIPCTARPTSAPLHGDRCCSGHLRLRRSTYDSERSVSISDEARFIWVSLLLNGKDNAAETNRGRRHQLEAPHIGRSSRLFPVQPAHGPPFSERARRRSGERRARRPTLRRGVTRCGRVMAMRAIGVRHGPAPMYVSW